MNNPAMLLWLGIFQEALADEYADRPRIVTLATVDAQNHPRARTVILRQIDNDGRLWITSSGKAEKNAHLRNAPFAEIVAYLPTRREQFRLAGAVKVIGQGDDNAVRQRFWQTLSDAARATFYWPIIGQPVQPGENPPAAIPASTPMPDHFELIAIHPEIVEHLTTASIPHRRTRWQQANEWEPERINP